MEAEEADESEEVTSQLNINAVVWKKKKVMSAVEAVTHRSGSGPERRGEKYPALTKDGGPYHVKM